MKTTRGHTPPDMNPKKLHGDDSLGDIFYSSLLRGMASIRFSQHEHRCNWMSFPASATSPTSLFHGNHSRIGDKSCFGIGGFPLPLCPIQAKSKDDVGILYDVGASTELKKKYVIISLNWKSIHSAVGKV